VVARVLDRLAAPAETAAATGIPEDVSDDGRAWSLWDDLSLAGGHPGVSLAFSGTAPRGPQHAERAHRHLLRAQARARGAAHPPAGIYSGPGALAMAILVAHRATGGYDNALRGLDAYQRRLVRAAVPGLASGPMATNGAFETVRGLAGIGRYLLARGSSCQEELVLLLDCLIAMTADADHRGRRVPRWWALAAPARGQEPQFPDGHLNLGLSHGVSGPLALLSLAWSQGVRTDGHREAIESLAGLLTRWAVSDGPGVRWPGYLTLEEWTRGRVTRPRSHRPSWCYGAPGVSRALQLAAVALDRADWHAAVRASVLSLLAEPRERWGVEDGALCHGWGGLLHLFGLLNEHLADERLARAADGIAALLTGAFDEQAPFGYRFPHRADLSGFLDGAAGIALALDAYAQGTTTAGWDMALLVA
jgi:hypothetical protein